MTYLTILFLSSSGLFAQQGFEAKVVDAYGNPLQKVEIRIADQVVGETNGAGRLSVRVNTGDILKFSCPGYLSRILEWGEGIRPVVIMQKDIFEGKIPVAFGIRAMQH